MGGFLAVAHQNVKEKRRRRRDGSAEGTFEAHLIKKISKFGISFCGICRMKMDVLYFFFFFFFPNFTLFFFFRFNLVLKITVISVLTAYAPAQFCGPIINFGRASLYSYLLSFQLTLQQLFTATSLEHHTSPSSSILFHHV